MKLSIKTYAKLLHELLSDADNELAVKKQIESVISLVYSKFRDVSVLDDFVNVFEDYYDSAIGVKKVFITTSFELLDGEKKRVCEIVKKITESDNINPSFKIDPELIGGVVIRTDDKLFDLSVNRSLMDLKAKVVL